jgi:hypothetical protein
MGKNSLKESFLPGVHLGEGSIAFKSAGHSQGEKAMAKMDGKRRKNLEEGRDNCKALLASIEKELAGDSEEDGGTKSAGAIEFRSPDMKTAIQDARSQPAFKSASVAFR